MKYIFRESSFYNNLGSKIKEYLNKISDNFLSNNDIHKIICDLINDINEIGVDNPKSKMLKDELIELLVNSYQKSNNKKEFFDEFKKCMQNQDTQIKDLFVNIINNECKECDDLNQVMENIIEQENYNMETEQFVNMVESKLGRQLNQNMKLDFYANSDLLTCIDNHKLEIENKLNSLQEIKIFVSDQ